MLVPEGGESERVRVRYIGVQKLSPVRCGVLCMVGVEGWWYGSEYDEGGATVWG